MTPDLILKHAAPVPRYTSYPTAPQFSPIVDAGVYSDWLASLPSDAALSLYVHIPFCSELCWFCGCHTRGIRNYAPVTTYLEHVATEIASVSRLVRRDARVTHIHWGGGSPDSLRPDDIRHLARLLRAAFSYATDAEFAVEIDPRVLTEEQIGAFAEAGVGRVSIGVQDFDERVQKAINRLQAFEATATAVRGFRSAGVGSINLDLVYGLPYQTEASLSATLDQALTLEPDRIALFGYAHLPERLRRQRLIPNDSLPGPLARFAQAELLARKLADAGYHSIGLDHFAKPTDSLAVAASSGALRRNFQGYTSDVADALIGFGASAIGQLPQGFAANATDLRTYQAMIQEQGLATQRGYALDDDDRIRAFVIERVMCDLEFPTDQLKTRFGPSASPILAEAARIAARDEDGLVVACGEGFRVTEKGRPLVRSICAQFDAHLAASQARHSAGV